VLKKLLAGPIRFTPVQAEGGAFYEFNATIALDGCYPGPCLQLWWRPHNAKTFAFCSGRTTESQ
jgi:hypothetical protein